MEKTVRLGNKEYRLADPPVFSYRYCCKEAKEVLAYHCVCAFVTWCDTHGLNHNGTHD